MYVLALRAYLRIILGNSVSRFISKQWQPAVSYHVQRRHESQISIKANCNAWAFLKSSLIVSFLLHDGNYIPWFMFCNVTVCTWCFVSMEGQCAVNMQRALFVSVRWLVQLPTANFSWKARNRFHYILVIDVKLGNAKKKLSTLSKEPSWGKYLNRWENGIWTFTYI